MKNMKIGIRTLIVGVVYLGVFGCSTNESVVTDLKLKESPPNILFILVDDLGWGDVGFLGSEIKTPNLDQLAANGVRLERGYTFPICSPTRAALLSGQNPLRYGVDGPMENDAMLSADLRLLPEYLGQQGYETWMVGKWHLGMAKRSAMPHSRGFDHFYGFLGGFIDFYTHIYFGGVDWQRNGKTLREQGYATTLLTNEALRLLESHDGKAPFFLYLSYNSPHTPLQYPPSVEETYDFIESDDRQVYAQMTTDVDAAIGKVMASLEQQGLLENTFIVFMSDNGGHAELGASNGPLRGGKGQVYEGGVRVPALVSWPKGLGKKGETFSQPIHVQDWLPTLLDLSGIDHEGSSFEGRSIWPALGQDESLPAVEPVVLGTNRSKAVYDWPWKLVRHEQTEDGQVVDELYHLVDDPFEQRNLAGQHPERIAKLGKYIDTLPRGESKAAKGPPPEVLFRGADGKFDYNVRRPESRAPWADAATPD